VVHESRRLDDRDVRDIDRIAVTTPERTILDLAAVRPDPDFLERVIHAARRKDLVSYESTREMFDRHARRGLRGVAALRIALDRWELQSRPTESDPEALLLHVLGVQSQ
jgi:hypothetical protein